MRSRAQVDDEIVRVDGFEIFYEPRSLRGFERGEAWNLAVARDEFEIFIFGGSDDVGEIPAFHEPSAKSVFRRRLPKNEMQV